jgi:hypothetical protein
MWANGNTHNGGIIWLLLVVSRQINNAQRINRAFVNHSVRTLRSKKP